MSENVEDLDQSENVVPEDFELTMGMEGGFAGRMEGYTVTAAGNVTHWEGKYPGENIKGESLLSADQVASIWAHVSSIGYFEQSVQEVGNMTTFMNVKGEGKSHRVTWVRILGEAPGNSPLEQLHEMCQQLVRQSLQDKMDNNP